MRLSRPRIAAVAATLATAAALTLTHCGAGGGIGLGILTLGISVAAPGGTIAQLRGKPTAGEWFASLIESRADADVVGLQPVPNAVVELFHLDASGQPIGAPIATVRTDASGKATFSTTLRPSADLVFQVSDASGTKRVRAFYAESGGTTAVDPVAEMVVRKVVTQVANGIPLANFSPSELDAIDDIARAVNVTAGADIADSINILEAAVGPLVDQAVGAAATSATNDNSLLSGSYHFATLRAGFEEGPPIAPLTGFMSGALESIETTAGSETGTATFNGLASGVSGVSELEGTLVWGETPVSLAGTTFSAGNCPVTVNSGDVSRNAFSFTGGASAGTDAFDYTVFGGGLFSIKPSNDPAFLGFTNPSGDVGVLGSASGSGGTSKISFALRREAGANLSGSYGLVGISTEVSWRAPTGAQEEAHVMLDVVTGSAVPVTGGFVVTWTTAGSHRRVTEYTPTTPLIVTGTFQCGGPSFGSYPVTATADSVTALLPLGTASEPATYTAAPDGSLTVYLSNTPWPLDGAIGAGGDYALLSSRATAADKISQTVWFLARAPSGLGPTPLDGSYNLVLFSGRQPQQVREDEISSVRGVLTFDGAGNVTLTARTADRIVRTLSEGPVTVQPSYTPAAISGGSVVFDVSQVDQVARSESLVSKTGTYSVAPSGAVTIQLGGGLFLKGFLSLDLSVILIADQDSSLDEEIGAGLAVKRP